MRQMRQRNGTRAAGTCILGAGQFFSLVGVDIKLFSITTAILFEQIDREIVPNSREVLEISHELHNSRNLSALNTSVDGLFA